VTVEGVSEVLVDRGSSEPPYTAEKLLESVRGAATGSAGSTVVPVLVDPEGESIRECRPDVIVDARMAKRNLGTTVGQASLTIALGPGFEAGVDADLVIETQRGPSLGRLIERGSALPNTGIPGEVAGASARRLIRSPAGGEFRSSAKIGDLVSEGQTVGAVAGVPVTVGLSGLLRGLAADGLDVSEGEKLGDVDPRGLAVDPRLISDKARKMGQSVLDALQSRGMAPSGSRRARADGTRRGRT
jgi:xanthine dehydrogenase accessory factor